MAVFRKFHHLYFLIPIVAFGLLYIVLSQTSLNINHDVTLFLEIGNRILDGQTPYVDFYEINFPMIQYISAIYVLVSRITGVHLIIVTHIMVWLLIGFSALSLYFLARRITDDKHLPYILPTMLIVYSTALHIPFNDTSHYGQRDHIFILLFLPFVLIRIQQWGADHNRGRWWRFIYGIIAGIGVSIKPFFVIISIILELYGFSQHRDWKRLFRAETVGFGLVALVHIVYFIIFPDIRNGLFDILSASSAYVDFAHRNDSNPFINWIVLDHIRNALFVFIMMWIFKYSSAKTALLVRTLCIVMVAGIFTFSIQRGYNYHLIPYHTILWILILYALARFLHPPHYNETQHYDLIRNPIMYISIISLLYLFVIYLNINFPDHTAFKELTDYQEFILEHTEEGESVYVIHNHFFTTPNLNYPALYQIERWNSSPYLNHFPYNWGWGLNLPPEEKITTEPHPIVEQWLKRLADDILEAKPRLIITHPIIHHYLELVGLVGDVITPNYNMLEENAGFIVYERQGN